MATRNQTDRAMDERRRRRAEWRNVIAMAIPVVITTSSRALMDVADFVMITWLHVDAAQAAILPAQLIMWSYIVIGMGVVSMVNTFAAQALGRKQHHECSAYAWQSLYMALALGAIGISMRPLLPDLIALFAHDPDVQQLELEYARVALLTIGPTLAAAGLGWFFIGIHRPWVTMWSVIEANVLNVCVSFILIFGYFGFEPMGIAGAAWGTLVGVSYRAVRLAVTMLAPSVDRIYASRSQWWFSWRRTKELVRVGLPCGLHWVSEVVVWAVFVNILIGTSFGTAHLVATNTAWQYMRLAFMPTLGVGQALTAVVGKSLGAGDPDRAVRETRDAAVLTFAYMGALSLLYALIGGKLIGLFNSDAEVVRVGTQIMICAAVFQLFDALGITYQSALRAAGDTFVPSAVFIVSSWAIIIGGGYSARRLVPEWGCLGPWLAASSFIAGTGLFLWWRWHGRAWMRINLVADTGKADPPMDESNAETGTAVAADALRQPP